MLPLHDLDARSPVDIWHTHLASTYDRRTPAALLKVRLSVKAVIITEHLPRSDASDPGEQSYEAPRRFAAWPAKTAFKRAEFALANRIICISEANRRFLFVRYGVPSGKTVVVPLGIAPSHCPAPWPVGAPHFIAIGSVISQKGFDILMEATALANESWHVVVIGDGAQLNSLRVRADEKALPIHFIGPSPDIRSALEMASALVVPSRWEAGPYVALEAMNCGRPVVATRVDGLSELVSDGETGCLVNPADPSALAAALDGLARDTRRAEVMGRAGWKRARRFSLERMLDGTIDTYASALQSGKYFTAASCRR
jgi:glycosyltransferase involved in cell wall biosynthesis